MKGKVMTIILVGALLCGSLAPMNMRQSEAASASKSVTVTLDKASPQKYVALYTNVKKPSGIINWNDAYYKKTGVQIKVQIISMKGKPKKAKISTLNSVSDGGKGCLLLKYNAKKFKSGIIYDDSKDKFHSGDTYIDLSLDDIKGVSKITYKITFANPSGKKIFKNVKVKKGYFESQDIS